MRKPTQLTESDIALHFRVALRTRNATRYIGNHVTLFGATVTRVRIHVERDAIFRAIEYAYQPLLQGAYNG